jgi:CheY-like chemotaxis protein
VAPEEFEPVMATTGQEALTAMTHQIPDIVTGHHDARYQRSHVTAKIGDVPGFSHIPVIILSSFEDDDTRTFALNAGADAVMSKRVTPLDLLDRIRQLLDRRA